MNYLNKSKCNETINKIIMIIRISGAVHILLLTGGYQSFTMAISCPFLIPVCQLNTGRQDCVASDLQSITQGRCLANPPNGAQSASVRPVCICSLTVRLLKTFDALHQFSRNTIEHHQKFWTNVDAYFKEDIRPQAYNMPCLLRC